MNPQDLGVVFAYYQACWAAFSLAALEKLLADKVLFLNGAMVQGKSQVLQLFQDKFFSRVDISKTEITSLRFEFSTGVQAFYTIKQTVDGVEETLDLLEEFVVENGLITLISRTKL